MIIVINMRMISSTVEQVEVSTSFTSWSALAI